MLRNVLLDNKTEVYSTVAGERIINLASQTFHFPDTFNYKLIQVGEGYIARPDKISKDLYGVPVYGDLICKINGISNPFELNEGDIIVVPDAQYLQDFIVEPQEDNTAAEEPRQKNRSTKRSSNESTVGDRRFYIDSARRVVVY